MLIERYNRQSAFEWERIRDFLILHYHATERDDTPFWTYCRTMDVPENLKDCMSLFRESGRFYRESEELFAVTSWVQVMLGQRIMPHAYHPMVDLLSEREIEEFVDGVKTLMDRCVAVMPTHADFIARYCAAPKM
jgi:tryptophan halogenase